MTLSNLHETLAQAHGLAISATSAVDQVERCVLDGWARDQLEQVRSDLDATRARCLTVEQSIGDPSAAEILAHVQTTRQHGADLVDAWFKAGTSPIEAWAFLTAALAAEVATWRALDGLLRDAAPPDGIAELVGWALPLHEGRLQEILDASQRLGHVLDGAASRIK
jgi:hypothetical protein